MNRSPPEILQYFSFCSGVDPFILTCRRFVNLYSKDNNFRNMQAGKHLLSICAVILFFIMATASVVGKNMMTVEKGQIPPDFVGYSGVLLIEHQARAWDRLANDNFTRYYKGPIQIVDIKELDTYSDLTRYRFMLSREIHRVSTYINGHTGYTSNESEYILDRKTGGKYITW